MNFEKVIAGLFSGAGALLLIYLGHVEVGATILGSMLGFFVGDWNGQKKKETSE